MSFNTAALPYQYETEFDPLTLGNGVQRQNAWEYTVEQSAQVNIGGVFRPLIVERLCHKARYHFNDYLIVSARIHEWQYLNEANTSYQNAVYGYRFYHDGGVLKGGVPHLQPEVGVIFGFTPDPKKIPAFIEIADPQRLTVLLTEAAARFNDSGTLNAWLSAPVDAPTDAPEDIQQTLKRMRKEVGFSATRGRGRMLQYLMEEVGVTLETNGWALTDEESRRRQQVRA